MNRRQLVTYAKSFVGIQFQKNSPSVCFDCSSFIRHIYRKQGIILPRTVLKQATCGTEVDPTNLRIADLLFFYVNEKYPTNDIPGHVGIYAGNGKMVHCIPTSNIFLTSINKAHWRNTFLFASRICNQNKKPLA